MTREEAVSWCRQKDAIFIDLDSQGQIIYAKGGSLKLEKPTEAVRLDEGKSPIHLIPPEIIHALAAVYAYGARKYAPRNWEKGMDWSRMYDSAMRHLLAFWGGEDIDAESGLPHVFHALWNCAGLAFYRSAHPDRDDRPGRVGV